MKKVLAFIIMLFALGLVSGAKTQMLSAELNDDTVILNVSSDFGFFSGSFEIKYDTDKLEFDSNEFDDRMSSATCLINPEYTENTIKVSILSLSEIKQGNICRIVFNKKRYSYGKAGFTVNNSMFCDQNADVMPTETDNAVVYVNLGSAPSNKAPLGNVTNNGISSEDQTDNTQKDTNENVTNPFADVKNGAWYYDAVMLVYKSKITTGISDTEFAPNGKVTRGQFITMLCRAYDIPEMTGDNFDDCGNTWYTGYLAAAKQLGVSKGVGNNKFSPETEITRQEMVTLIYNYLKSIGKADNAAYKGSFSDNDMISDWAKPAVDFASSKGYVKGKGNNMFDPLGTAMRAELAQIFYNILQG